MFDRPRYKRETVNDLMRSRVVINGETAIKPYYYLRNGMLHVRYTVDRCIALSKDESLQVKDDLSQRPSDKQNILSEAWNFFVNCVGKTILNDGIEISYLNAKKLGKDYDRRKN